MAGPAISISNSLHPNLTTYHLTTTRNIIIGKDNGRRRPPPPPIILRLCRQPMYKTSWRVGVSLYRHVVIVIVIVVVCHRRHQILQIIMVCWASFLLPRKTWDVPTVYKILFSSGEWHISRSCIPHLLQTLI